MVRSQAVTCRTICIHDTGISVTCPKCKTRWSFCELQTTQVDSCGFESYSFQCQWCASSHRGVIDPSDDALLVSLIEPGD